MRMTIAEGMEWGVALPVFGALRVLAAVEFDNQAPLKTNAPTLLSPDWGEGWGPIDRRLASEFKAAQPATANACPQRQFRRRERVPQ
jgi:hypothetical protein